MSILTPAQLQRVRKFQEGGGVSLDQFILDNPNYAQMVNDFRNANMDESQIVGMLQDAGLNVAPAGQNNAGGNVRTADFQDSNANGIDDRDEGQAGGDAAGGGATTTGGGAATTGGGTTTTTTGGGGAADTSTTPFVSGVTKSETRLDPITQQLLFGLDGEGGFIPGAFQAAERTFFDAQGRPIVVPKEVAGFSPDQIRAMNLARSNVGVQQPFIEEAMRRGQQGIGSIQRGLEDQALASQRALDVTREGSRFALDQRDLALMDAMRGTQQGRGRAIAAEERLRGDISDLSRKGVRDTQRFGMDLARARQQGRKTYDEFGRDITDTVGMSMTEAQRLRSGLGESEKLLRGTTGDVDIGSQTSKYFDPYEDQVVQQMVKDATEGLAKQDMAQYARDISSGGESAFGSRARLSAEERAEAMGRGLSEGVGALRSQGFQRAQQTAIAEDERKRQAARSASAGLAGLRGQAYGAGRDVTGQMGQAASQKLAAGQGYGNLIQQTAQSQLGAQQQLGGQLGQMAQQRYAAGTGLGQTLSGYGQQDAAARQMAGQTGMNVASTMAGQYGQIGQQQAQAGQQLGAAQTGYGSFLSGLGSQAQQAGAQDVAALQGAGGMAQQQRQAQLDAQRANLLQAQQAPLAQYQALMPFVNMAPAGQTQFQTNFAPNPSALQAGVGTGLATLGAMGNFYGQPQRQYGAATP